MRAWAAIAQSRVQLTSIPEHLGGTGAILRRNWRNALREEVQKLEGDQRVVFFYETHTL